jgi:hypothetical protein
MKKMKTKLTVIRGTIPMILRDSHGAAFGKCAARSSLRVMRRRLDNELEEFGMNTSNSIGPKMSRSG